MPEILPFTSDPAQSFTVALAGNKYTLEARYNDRSGGWTFDITQEPEGELLAAGIPLLIGQDMLEPYALGIGGLLATDLATGGVDVGPEDLGDRVIVTWLSPDELAALPAIERPDADADLPDAPPPAPLAFVPTDLGPTLKLWLRADLGVSQIAGEVSAWADQSGNGNTFAQSGAAKPTLVSGAIGGRAAIRFALQQLLSDFQLSGPKTIFLVRKATTIPGPGSKRCVVSIDSAVAVSEILVTNSGSYVPTLFLNDTVGFPATVGSATAIDTNAHVLELTFNGGSGTSPGSYTYRRDGGAETVVTSTVQSVPNQTKSCIAGRADGSEGADEMDLGELIICDSVLSAPNAALVRNYLSERYSLGVD